MHCHYFIKQQYTVTSFHFFNTKPRLSKCKPAFPDSDSSLFSNASINYYFFHKTILILQTQIDSTVLYLHARTLFLFFLNDTVANFPQWHTPSSLFLRTDIHFPSSCTLHFIACTHFFPHSLYTQHAPMCMHTICTAQHAQARSK